jgi:HD-GYP domain-containing protein (c-di-GMP phosphodiesterase class II)
MVGLPPDVMGKSRTERTGPETQLYRSHPVLGEIILKEITFLKPVARLVRWHHEQFNGKGFPDGLSGDAVPIGAQIIGAASIYDNMIHRGKIALEEIPDHLYRMRHYQLSSPLVDALIIINREEVLSEQKKNAVEVPIHELQEGMQLAQDVRRTNGALILPAHTDINQSGIEKLKKHCELACISDKVFIFKDSLKG